MKRFERAFLGLILAGVLMLAVGIGLMMSLDRSPFSDSRLSLAQRQAVERAPASEPDPDSNKPATPSVR